MTTNATFLAAIQGLSVTGIAAASHYDEPPASLNTGDLPAFWPMLPGANLGETVVSCFANNKTRTIQVITALEAAGQGTIPQNYALIVPAMDNLESALDGLAKSQGGTLANWIDYTITTGTVVDVAGNEYWAVVADVTARDNP